MAPAYPDSSADRFGDSFKLPSDGFEENERARIDTPFDPAEQEREGLLASFPPGIVRARDAVGAALRRQGSARQGVRAVDDVSEATNILGVAISKATAADVSSGRAHGDPGSPVLRVFLAQERSHEHVRAVVTQDLGLGEGALEGVDVIPVVTGLIEARTFAGTLRPAPGGVSLGHHALPGFGTLGCLVRGRRPPRDERVMILSNNHVMAQTNGGLEGDCICQPAPGDGGSCPDFEVALLDRYVPISFGGGSVNYVDGATAWAYPDRVSPQILSMTPEGPSYFSIGTAPAEAYVGMPVGKSGRRTGLTLGYVRETGAQAWIDYGGGNSAFFAGLITIESTEGLFSDKGDSGSLVWTWDGARQPVGLFFADGGGTSFANPISLVLAALDCDIIA